MVRWTRRPVTDEHRHKSDDLRERFLASADRLDNFARALAATVDQNKGDSDDRQRPGTG